VQSNAIVTCSGSEFCTQKQLAGHKESTSSLGKGYMKVRNSRRPKRKKNLVKAYLSILFSI